MKVKYPATESVETIYNGITYRSRTEARWSVFFDAAGIEAVYEPEPPLVFRRSPRGLRGNVDLYLPDFWLPAPRQYCEVKGWMAPDIFARILDIARDLTRRGTDLVVLNNIPSVWDSRFPVQLTRTGDGRLVAVPWDLGPPRLSRAVPEADITPELLLKGHPTVCPEWAEPHLTAARWYKFPATAGPLTPRRTQLTA